MTRLFALTALAAAACQSASGAAPAAPPLHEPLLALSYRAGDDAAVTAAQGAARARPDDAAAQLDLAELMLRRKREAGDPRLLTYAADALAAARDRAPREPRVLALRTVLLQEEHRFAEAGDAARALVAAAPADPTGHLLLGDALLELGRYEEAIAAYQRAVDLVPDLRGYARAGYVRWLHGDLDGALELMTAALESGSPRAPESSAWCWVDLGAMLRQAGRLDESLAAADAALGLVPDYPPARALRARVLAARGDAAAAVAELERLPPRLRNAEELAQLADLYAALGRADDATRTAADLARHARTEPRAVALYYARHGLEPATALTLAERELGARPDVYSHDVAALALLRTGRVADAAAASERALALGTPDARFHLHRALIRRAAGDEPGARAALAAALAIDPHADPLLVAELRAAR